MEMKCNYTQLQANTQQYQHRAIKVDKILIIHAVSGIPEPDVCKYVPFY